MGKGGYICCTCAGLSFDDAVGKGYKEFATDVRREDP